MIVVEINLTLGEVYEMISIMKILHSAIIKGFDFYDYLGFTLS